MHQNKKKLKKETKATLLKEKEDNKMDIDDEIFQKNEIEDIKNYKILKGFQYKKIKLN